MEKANNNKENTQEQLQNNIKTPFPVSGLQRTGESKSECMRRLTHQAIISTDLTTEQCQYYRQQDGIEIYANTEILVFHIQSSDIIDNKSIAQMLNLCVKFNDPNREYVIRILTLMCKKDYSGMFPTLSINGTSVFEIKEPKKELQQEQFSKQMTQEGQSPQDLQANYKTQPSNKFVNPCWQETHTDHINNQIQEQNLDQSFYSAALESENEQSSMSKIQPIQTYNSNIKAMRPVSSTQQTQNTQYQQKNNYANKKKCPELTKGDKKFLYIVSLVDKLLGDIKPRVSAPIQKACHSFIEVNIIPLCKSRNIMISTKMLEAVKTLWKENKEAMQNDVLCVMFCFIHVVVDQAKLPESEKLKAENKLQKSARQKFIEGISSGFGMSK